MRALPMAGRIVDFGGGVGSDATCGRSSCSANAAAPLGTLTRGDIDMTQAIEWYYGREGQQRGPVNEMALRELAATGQLAPSDLVWCAGMTQWAPAQSVPNLFPQ